MAIGYLEKGKTMRLIDADALLNREVYYDRTECLVLRYEIEKAPTIDAEPVKHGRWIHDINNLYGCSECMERETMSHKKLKVYCPNCGAKMDKKDGENDG